MANVSVDLTINARCQTTSASDLATGSVTQKLNPARTRLDLATGTADNQATWVYGDVLTIAAGGNTVLDLYDFDGAKDVLGNAYTNTELIGFLLELQPNANSSMLNISGTGSSGSWETGFVTGATDKIEVQASATHSGVFLVQNPKGWSTPSSDTDLKITNLDGSNAVNINVLIWGH
tara:strand:- start:2023 stop:2553 length:531 start_codon:yes stop_codon:yes gene_type:complete